MSRTGVRENWWARVKPRMIAGVGIAAFVALVCVTNVSWAQEKKEEPKPAAPTAAPAPAPAPAPKDPTIEERVADLEALTNSTTPTVPATRKSNVSYSPGDNAWLLTSSALVLMM